MAQYNKPSKQANNPNNKAKAKKVSKEIPTREIEKGKEARSKQPTDEGMAVLCFFVLGFGACALLSSDVGLSVWECGGVRRLPRLGYGTTVMERNGSSCTTIYHVHSSPLPLVASYAHVWKTPLHILPASLHRQGAFRRKRRSHGRHRCCCRGWPVVFVHRALPRLVAKLPSGVGTKQTGRPQPIQSDEPFPQRVVGACVGQDWTESCSTMPSPTPALTSSPPPRCVDKKWRGTTYGRVGSSVCCSPVLRNARWIDGSIEPLSPGLNTSIHLLLLRHNQTRCGSCAAP